MTSLHLRPMVLADFDALSPAQDPRTAGEFAWYGYRTDHLQLRHAIQDGKTVSSAGGMLSIEIDATAEFAGIVSWEQRTNGDPQNGRCWEIGIYLNPEHRGNRYAAVAQSMLAGYLFQHTVERRLQAVTEALNEPERRALLAAGFQQEGVLRQAIFRGGQYRDLVMYSMLREDCPPPTR